MSHSNFVSTPILLTSWCFVVIGLIVKPSFSSQTFRHVTFVKNGGEMAGPFMFKKGFVFPVGRNQMMSSHGLEPGHRSRPRLQSPDSNLDRSSNMTETPSSTAYDLWDDYGGHHIFLACSSDPLGLYSPRRPPRKQYVLIMTRMPRTPIPRGVRRGAGTKGGPMTTRLKMKCHCLLLGRVLEM